MPREIIIPKIHLIREGGEICWIDQDGAYYADEIIKENYNKEVKKLVKEHLDSPRVAIHDNGD
jgi:hypothetical protein